MAEYVCIKELCLDTYDDDGFFVESGNAFVEVGEVFQKSEEKFRCVGDIDSIRLDNDKQWLEISEQTFYKHFKELNTRTSKEKNDFKEE